jgi:diguanylate cyclase (GGDEF)-like protein
MATRAAAALMLVGAALLVVTVILPPAAKGSDVLILCLGAVAGALGIAMLLIEEAPEWLLGVGIATGTVVITVATAEAGLSGTGAEDNEILYLWICLYSFYFLRMRHALAQLGIVAVAYGLLLTLDAPAETVVTRWLITITTLLVAGILVARLRGSLERNVDELERRAGRDPLTGALNRRALEERASIRVADAKRDVTPLSVIVIDIDHLKELNDTLGHAAGDEALRITADSLEKATREGDTVARTGGDEFVILLPRTPESDARASAERLQSLGRARLVGLASTGLSIGVATAEGTPDLTFASLWKLADAHMYEAKRAGGDRIRVTAIAPTLVPEQPSLA